MKDDLNRLLNTYQPPAPAPAAREALLAAWRAAPRQTLSPAGFLRAQLCFIRPRMWAAQGLLLSVLAWLTRSIPRAEQVYLLLGVSLPLLLIINIVDFVRVYNGGMLELELATRYSLPQVCAARMLIFGTADSAAVLLTAAQGAAATRTHLFTLLLYCLTPFVLVCVGCLTALRFLRPDRLLLSCVLITMMLAILLIAWRRPLYLPQYRPCWLAMLALAAGLLGVQGHALQKKGVFSCKL